MKSKYKHVQKIMKRKKRNEKQKKRHIKDMQACFEGLNMRANWAHHNHNTTTITATETTVTKSEHRLKR